VKCFVPCSDWVEVAREVLRYLILPNPSQRLMVSLLSPVSQALICLPNMIGISRRGTSRIQIDRTRCRRNGPNLNEA